METETILLDCPACGGWYVEDAPCECGYCSHSGIIEGTCPLCGVEVEPTMAEMIAELLDAADEVLVRLAVYPNLLADLAVYPALLFEVTFALPTLSGPAGRLRQIVTRLQGTAGLRVAGNG